MSFTPRFGLRAKLMTGAAVLSAFTAVVGFGAIQDSNQNVDRSIQLFDGAVVPLNALGDVDGAFNESRAYTNDHILETDPAKRRELETKLAADDAKIDKLLQVAVDAPQSAADRAKLTELQDDMKQYRSLRAQVLALSNQGSDREAYALNKAKVLPVVNEAAEEFAVALAQKSRLAEQTFNESVAAARAGRTRTIVMLGFALVAGFGMAFVFSRRITQAVKQIVNRLQLLREHCATDLSNALQAVTEGDLTVTVTPVTPELERSSKDEIGDIAEAVNDIRNRTVESVLAYNTMVGQLSETMAELSEQASTVAAASQQMAATSEETGRAVSEIAAAVTEVAHGAERQVRGVEATREAVQAAASSAQTSSEVAAQTAQAADDARSVALEGVTAAASASAAMIEVAESSAAVGTAIHHLTERSERIGGIVGTITGLAEQTNLLALNAAIEAARAGEQGRGFAVVAEEVRKLAEESRGAAAEISSLIREMQDETSRVVGVVAEGTQRTQDGVATVERTREAFEAIGDAVEDMAARVGEISTAVDQISAEATRAENEVVEVAAVAEESSASAEQVSASTQQTSASAQEIAASAQTLSGTAEHLNSLVGRFKVA